MARINVEHFADLIYKILKSDRDVVLGIGGFTGEGKSTFAIQLQRAYAKISKTKWDYDHITWSREELLMWIDGKGDQRKGQKPEYSALLPDELISMFYKRNWYEDAQKAAVELFNKCRDRHLFMAGNVPDFWDLDSGFINRVRFYSYIPKRGVAWVFQQENNPFVTDKWNRRDNLKMFRKHKHPYKCPNFLFEIKYPDLEPDEKIDYLDIRNTKRLKTENQNKRDKVERYSEIKRQRDILIRTILGFSKSAKDFKKDNKEISKEILEFAESFEINTKELAELIGLHKSMINFIRVGAR